MVFCSYVKNQPQVHPCPLPPEPPFHLPPFLEPGSEDKASICNAGDLSSIPGLGRSPGEGNGNQLQYSCLEHPMDRGAWWAIVHGVTKSRTRLHFHFHLDCHRAPVCPFLLLCLLPFIWPQIFHDTEMLYDSPRKKLILYFMYISLSAFTIIFLLVINFLKFQLCQHQLKRDMYLTRPLPFYLTWTNKDLH